MIREQHLTGLPGSESPVDERTRPNLSKDAQEFVNAPFAVAGAAVDQLNLGVASLTNGISPLLPSFHASRLFVDKVFGWPHYHLHPPNLVPPAPPIFLPGAGPVICAGAVNVLTNSFPAARRRDVGFGAWGALGVEAGLTDMADADQDAEAAAASADTSATAL